MTTVDQTPPADSGSKFGYVPALDGVRGVAILVVMIFHADASFMQGGFLGVDLFFVLSGFLITALLIREFDSTSTIGFKAFYLRRVLRLAPALVLGLLVFCIASIAVLGISRAKPNLLNAIIALFYMANWARAFDFARMGIIGHTWSLSIEEQFYIVWPAMLLLMMRLIKSRRMLFFVVLALALIPCLWRTYLILHDGTLMRVYNGTDTRADSLLSGCLVAVLLDPRVATAGVMRYLKTAIRFIGPLSIPALAYIFLRAQYNNPHMALWVYIGVETSAAVLILECLLNGDGIIARVLSGRPLVWIGKISYGLYLWHFPVFETMYKIGFTPLGILLIGPLIVFAIATLSYYLLERPFLRLKKKYSHGTGRE